MPDRFSLFRAWLGCCVLAGSGFQSASAADDPAGLEFFESRIRPVLVEQCYSCHSADAASQGKLRGGLSLDSRPAMRRGGETGPGIVPGKPDESLVLAALKHETFEMPPKGKLSDTVIADFEKWIRSGAPDPREGEPAPKAPREIDVAAGRSFWAFQPLAAPTPPEVDDATNWCRTPIDQFVLARQQSAGLHPNKAAPAAKLIRRAWFDLLGLPPSPEEMAHWTARLAKGQAAGDINPTVWSELLDQLLNNRHFGERWARHWLDVSRFAESHGYEQDYDRPTAYHYRDFVIKALNDDLPYNTFVKWQLAGDELAPDNPLAWMATGFLGAGAFPTQLTEKEFESARYDELDDMVATTGVAFLGLSIGCARCHDHKFDPISSLDYYQMAATFTTVIRGEKEFDLEPEANAARRLEFSRKEGELREALAAVERDVLPDELSRWLKDLKPESLRDAEWLRADGTVESASGTKFQSLADGSFLAQGSPPAKDVLTVRIPVDQGEFGSLRIEALADESLPQRGPGRAGNGNFVLSHVTLKVVANEGGVTENAPFAVARATHQQNETSLSVATSLDADPATGWAVDGQIGKDQAAVFELASPLVVTRPAQIIIEMRFEHPNPQHSLGRFRLSLGRKRSAAPVVSQPEYSVAAVKVLSRLAGQPEDRTSADWNAAIDWYRSRSEAWRQANEALQTHLTAGPGVVLTKVLVATEGLPPLPHHADGRGFPHFYPETHFLRRGDVEQKGDIVDQGFVRVLMTEDRKPHDWSLTPPAGWERTTFRRAALANWITDVERGGGALAARVVANRIWQHHFGRGLVATPNDFGASGERPSHPELLEWLAADLVQGEWRLKRLHKLLMSSSVYLQSTQVDEQRAAIDPENILLWRRSPRRLEAEAIRDAMLDIGGQLDPTPYGPGTLDANMKRRSVYFSIKRSQLIPMMMLFDWPEHLVSIGQRSTTTIAPQALAFLNSPQGRSFAEGFASRLPAGRQPAIEMAYRLAFGREPTSAEQAAVIDFLDQQTKARGGDAKPDAARLAMIDLCQTLFSMNEFIYID
ncbi:MAG: PSD1 domain-containing protein [Planctomycetaceae bacterium]|nr:PSD1 domain-containing protein [Planctomycetaceae bacterium]